MRKGLLMKKISSCLILFSAILIVAAYSHGEVGTPSADEGSAPIVSDTMIACVEDADCVVVEIGCCDHCNGGEVVSVSTAYAEEVEEDYREDCGGETICTLKGCPQELPRCREGECEHFMDTSRLF